MKSSITKYKPESSLTNILPKHSGRNNLGHITVRHRGGRHKRFYRDIDFTRGKTGVAGRVTAIEYDPNRNVDIALVQYEDGERRYILLPVNVGVGDAVTSGVGSEIRAGNSLPLREIPVGTSIHNIELSPGHGGQIVRGAGTMASVLAKEGTMAHVKLPSGEVRTISLSCMATVGQLSGVEWKSISIGKAGRARHMGRRPVVRGTAQNPSSHPHGGGEGRSGEGMHPKTPWGKAARGLKTRNRGKYSNRSILTKRKK